MFSIDNGQTDGVFMWWECNMDWENEIVMSCAPKWANNQFELEFPVKIITFYNFLAYVMLILEYNGSYLLIVERSLDAGCIFSKKYSQFKKG